MIPRHTMHALLLACCLFTGLGSHEAFSSPLHPARESRAGDVEPAADYEAVLTAILHEAVTDEGLVRYELLRGALNPDFRRVLKAIEEFDATTLRTHEEKLAFWMNAYNVQMLQNIIETPQVNEIVEDGFGDAFFETPFCTARTGMTLNEIENVILRRQAGRAALEAFQLDRLDPRLHVGVHCAAVSCPRLRSRAFTEENVNDELDAAMRDFTGSTHHFRIQDDRLILSSLLDWYGDDFDHAGLPAGDFILRYMPATRPDYAALKDALAGQSSAALKAMANVKFEYHWEVNRAS